MDNCILFTGHLNNKGYGQRTIKQKHWLAHRAAWVEVNGSIPDGMCVLHRCDTPACINPNHLFLGTQADNIADMITKGRDNKQRRLSTEDIVRIKQRYADGEYQYIIARDYELTQSMISRIVNENRYVGALKGLDDG